VELRSSAKENAELVMITDLLRNDLGRICDYGTVQVQALAELEAFSHVQHLVSTVQGQIRSGLSPVEALQACFPGGSVTGAPKIRAMEIIDELETEARGPYTGCLGYLGFNGQCQLAMTIRTALCARDRVHFHTGAGIVSDSDPAAEFEETSVKARGFLAALGISPRFEIHHPQGDTNIPFCSPSNHPVIPTKPT
jgi:para-aminobenzoate synthetase component 1